MLQQAGEIDNLTVKLGQSILIVLCAGSTSLTSQTFLAPLTPQGNSLFPTDSITLVSQLRETCCCTTSYLPLGVPNNTSPVHQAFFWRRCRGKKILLQGESLTSNLFILLLSCLVYFYYCLVCLISKIQKK